jgi:hypothetical protein
MNIKFFWLLNNCIWRLYGEVWHVIVGIWQLFGVEGKIFKDINSFECIKSNS